MDLSTFSAASDSGSLAADVGGDASGNPLSYAKTAYDVASSLGKLTGLFGGGAGYATNQGIRLYGSLTPTGFTGNAYTITTAGNNPFTGVDATVNATIGNKYATATQQLVGANGSIPIDLTSSNANWSTVFTDLNNYLTTGFNKAGITMADTTTTGTGLAAPDLSSSGTTATGLPGTVAGVSGSTTTSTAGGSTVTSAPIVASPIVGTIIPSVPDWIVYIGLGLVAWHLYKHGKA